MNREILFRGKQIDNGEWVHGDLQTPKIKYFNADSYFITTEEGITYQVAPETVGQFTGLPDKNGTRIWEGDVVKVLIRDNGSRPTGTDAIWHDCTGIVVFEKSCFRNKCSSGIFTTTGLESHEEMTVEVIGNKWDNPELLEVANK